MNKKPLKKNEIIGILKNIKLNNIDTETIDLFNAENRILSEQIISSLNLPPFNNSAVDGYAIRDDDINSNNELKLNHRIVAGENKDITLNKGEVARIFTGAKMPKNSKTVIMQENVNVYENMITINKNIQRGENCRLAGEDVEKGSKVFSEGQKIKHTNLSLLAAIGKKFIKVNKKLKIGYFTSGNELSNPSENLIGSQINNSNQYALSTLLNKNYLDAIYLGNLKDTKDSIISTFKKKINDYSIIITTGGASVGEEDYFIDILKENGELFFWKTAIKPGRPLAIGKINNTVIICLPGNPVSVYLLYGMLIKSFIENLCGLKEFKQIHHNAIVNFSMKKKSQRLEWIRVNIDNNFKNEIHVNKYPKQGSGMISSIAFSDGIIEIPEEINQINKGDKYKFYFFRDLFA